MEQTILRETTNINSANCNKEEEEEASATIWKYVFGFTEMAVVKCAIDLGIPEILETNGGSMSISELSSAVGCPQPYLHRIMRFLSHRKIFKQSKTTDHQGTSTYTQTPLSRQLILMAPFVLLESSTVMLAPWLALSRRIRDSNGHVAPPFEAVHGEDVWSYAAKHASHSKLINDAMACDARVVVPEVMRGCPSLFDGVETVVDVGGGDGTALSIIVEGCPWLKGINFDLPHVVAKSSVQQSDRLMHVGGDMFVSVPKADAVFIMWVLHDWGDEECIQILNKCKEAITSDGKAGGKVIIAEAVIEDESEDKLQDARLMLDMVMMAHTTNGKERSLKEWSHLLRRAGFSHFNVKPIQAVQSIIEAYP